MERLTIREKDGQADYIEPLKFYKIIERLSDFEEIVAPDGAEEYDLSRLKELVEADREGRVAVVPCRQGDVLWTYCTYPQKTVYSFCVTDIAYLNGRMMLNTDKLSVISAEDVGKTVFLTREAAEKALEVKNGG